MIDMIVICTIRIEMGNEYCLKKEEAFLDKLDKFIKKNNASLHVDEIYEG